VTIDQQHHRSTKASTAPSSRLDPKSWNSIGNIPFYSATHNTSPIKDLSLPKEKHLEAKTSTAPGSIWSTTDIYTPRLLTPMATADPLSSIDEGSAAGSTIQITPWRGSLESGDGTKPRPSTSSSNFLPDDYMPGVVDNKLSWSKVTPMEVVMAKAHYEKAISSLQDQCSKMMQRMMQMEVQIAIQNKVPKIESSLSGLDGIDSNDGKRDGVSKRPMSASSTNSIFTPEVNDKFNELQTMLASFKNLFVDDYTTSPLAIKAATVINAAARGYLSRRKRRLAIESMMKWRSARAAPILKIINDSSERLKYVNNVVQFIRNKMQVQLTKSVFGAFKDYWMDFREIRKQQQIGADLLRKRILQNFVGEYFVTWFECSSGPHSSKSISKDYARRYDEAYKRIAQTVDVKKITRVMVKEEVAKDVEKLMAGKMRINRQSWALLSWADFAIPKQKKNKLAKRHYIKKLKETCMLQWVEATKNRLNDNIVMLPAGTTVVDYSFEPKHNIKKIVEFYRLQLLKKVFYSAKYYLRPRAMASVRYKKKRDHLIRSVYNAWWQRTLYQHDLRARSLATWKEYGERLVSVPFRAWYLWANEAKHERVSNEAIILAAKRRSRYRLIHKIFKYWKHQAVFGRVDGMRSRMELMQVLDEQRMYLVSLEEGISKFKKSLKDADAALDAEKVRSAEKDKLIEAQALEVSRLKYALHNAEQEIVRLQCLIDNITLIHPGTVKRLNSLPSTQKFPDRGTTKYARQRNSGDGPPAPPNPDAAPSAAEGDGAAEAAPAVDAPACCSECKRPLGDVPVTSETEEQTIKRKGGKKRRFSMDSGSESSGESADEGDKVKEKEIEEQVKVEPLLISATKEQIELVDRCKWVLDMVNTAVKRPPPPQTQDGNSGSNENVSSGGETKPKEKVVKGKKKKEMEDMENVLASPPQLSLQEKWQVCNLVDEPIRKRVASLTLQDYVSETHRLMALLDYMATGSKQSQQISVNLTGVLPTENIEELKISLKKGPFEETPSWNEFLNGLYNAYPLQHKVCVKPKDKIQARLTDIHNNLEKQTTVNHEPLNVYKK
jgi:hypothetical protein